MADETTQPPGGPEAPPARENDQALPGLADTIAADFKPAKPGKESPRKTKAAAAEGGAGGDRPVFDPGIVRRAVESLCRTVDRFVVRRTVRIGTQITGDGKLAVELASEAQMTPEEIQTISTLSESIAQQYGMIGEHTPAVMLAVTVAGYTARSFYVLNQLETIARENARASAPKAEAAPETK